LAQEVVALVAEAGLHRPPVAARQDRDEIALAGLAGAEHANAHAPARRARELAALVANLLQLTDQRRRLLRHRGGFRRGALQPRPASAGGTRQCLAVLGQFEIDGVHYALPGLEHAGVEPVALSTRQGLQSERQAIERDGAAVAIGHLAQAEALDITRI